jgi:hypothetical protein
LTAAPFSNQGKLDLVGGAGSGKVYLFARKGDSTFAHTVVGHRYYIATILDVLLLLAISITMANWISSFQRGHTRIRQASK